MSITQWKDLAPEQLLALKQMAGEKGVFIRASLLKALKGDGTAAVLLSQLVYWSQTEIAKENEGWFYLTTNRVHEDLGMSSDVQQRVRKMLVERGILEFQRRGLPARNYYRLHFDVIVQMVAQEFYEGPIKTGDMPHQVDGNAPNRMRGNPSTGEGETPHPVEGKLPDIVNTGVRIPSTSSLSSGKPKRAAEPVHVLGDRFDDGLAFIRQTYPVDRNGLPVTEHKARQILKKLGDLKPTHTPEEWKAARAKLDKFMKGLVNIRNAVNAGDLETRYVPGFDKFAGLKIMYGEEPSYVAWSEKVPVVKKPKLVV